MTDQVTRIVPAGWYEDPASPMHVRWWNGLAWTEHTAVKPPAPPAPTPVPVAAPAVADPASVATVPTTVGGADSGLSTVDRIAEVRELERQYGIGTAENDVIALDAVTNVRAVSEPETYRAAWQADENDTTGFRRATASSWLIALWPVFTLVAVLTAGYLYFYVSPEPALAVPLLGDVPIAVGIVIVPLLFTIIWAIADARKLRQFGHRPASAAFALLGPLVYLIARRVRVRGIGPLITLLALTVLAAGGPVAAWATGAATPVVTALTIQQTVSDALIAEGAVTSVSCPIFIESMAPGTLYTCDAVLPNGESQTVWVSIDTADGDFSFALSLR